MNLEAPGGEFRMIIHVKRANSGKVETYEMIGKVAQDGPDTLDDRKKRSD